MIRLSRTNSRNDDFLKLSGYLDGELNNRYGQLQEQYNQFNKVDTIQNVVIAYQENQPVACGCFKVFDQDTIEIKRMYAEPRTRGKGIAGMILSELEQWAVELGFSNAVLETGIKQPEAIRFYRKNGYLQTENWGQYIGNPNSVYAKETYLILSRISSAFADSPYRTEGQCDGKSNRSI